MDLERGFKEAMEAVGEALQQERTDTMENAMSGVDTYQFGPQEENMSDVLINMNNERKKAIQMQKDVATATANQTFDDKYYDKFNDFNIIMEGNKDVAYVPSSYDKKTKTRSYGNSGVTIGQGLDMGQLSETQAREFGVPETVITKLKHYEAFGAQGAAAAKIARKMKKDNYKIGELDMIAMNKAVYKKYRPEIKQLSETHPNLNSDAIVMLAQGGHWGGSLKAVTKNSSKFTRYKNFKFRGRGELTNPLAEALEFAPNMSNDDLAVILGEYRDGLPTGYKLNRTTFGRYINKVKRGHPDKKV